MPLQELVEKDVEKTAKLLADYWKERGMPNYNQKWAKDYLAEGHRKEIIFDKFFVFKENKKVIAAVSLIAFGG